MLHSETKKKAVAKYKRLLSSGQTREGIRGLMKEEEFTDEEISEILAGIDEPAREKIIRDKLAPGAWDPKNPNAIINNDFDYNNLVGPEWDRYNALLEKLSPKEGIVEHTYHEFDFELHGKVKPVRKETYPGMNGTPIELVGIQLRPNEPVINKTRITIQTARTLNEQITNAHSVAGHGRFYLLKKLS